MKTLLPQDSLGLSWRLFFPALTSDSLLMQMDFSPSDALGAKA